MIVNPVAGRGRTQKLFPTLEAHLRACKLSYELRFTSRPGEAEELAKEATQRGFRGLVAVGGDGTAHEVANGLIGSSLALGVIPTGSGNDFAKAIGVPKDLPAAIELLIWGMRRRVDVGRLGARYFINGLGVGLDGAVSHRFRRMKHLRGELAYLWGAIHEALIFQPMEIDLHAPAWTYQGSALLAGASNGQYHGGNFKLAPEAQVDDGLLDVYVIQNMPPIKRLFEIPKVRRGAHLSLEEVEMRRAPWVEIAARQPLPAHMDGEPFQLEPGRHKVEVLPRALEVISANLHARPTESGHPCVEASPTGVCT